LMNPSASKETLQECTTLAALLTAPQDLCEAHIRDLESWCSFSYKSEFRLGHSLPFFQCSLSPHMTLTRGLGKPVNLHITYWHTYCWMDPFGPKYQDQVSPPIFGTECMNKLQEFEWSVVQWPQQYCPWLLQWFTQVDKSV
jgi:hypothetical protein